VVPDEDFGDAGVVEVFDLGGEFAFVGAGFPAVGGRVRGDAGEDGQAGRAAVGEDGVDPGADGGERGVAEVETRRGVVELAKRGREGVVDRAEATEGGGVLGVVGGEGGSDAQGCVGVEGVGAVGADGAGGYQECDDVGGDGLGRRDPGLPEVGFQVEHHAGCRRQVGE